MALLSNLIMRYSVYVLFYEDQSSEKICSTINWEDKKVTLLTANVLESFPSMLLPTIMVVTDAKSFLLLLFSVRKKLGYSTISCYHDVKR